LSSIELKTRWLGRTFQAFDSLPSTNDTCKEQIESLPHGAAITARAQYCGKGTKGRQWANQPGQAVFLSFVLKGVRLESLTLLPLLCGLAEVEALSELGIKAGIKWPNDIVLNGKKISGILCESVIFGGRIDVVCGIGVNVQQTPEQFVQSGLPYAGSILSETGRLLALDSVINALLNKFEVIYEEYLSTGFDQLKGRYEEHCVTLHKQVRVLNEGREQTAFAEGIAADGRLICSVDGKQTLIDHGEASVRGLWGYV
jgi:BirA family transcriptional regulator, biotin operon repressor / biotin---[acetyl-CoA-carboxylase] ligase